MHPFFYILFLELLKFSVNSLSYQKRVRVYDTLVKHLTHILCTKFFAQPSEASLSGEALDTGA